MYDPNSADISPGQIIQDYNEFRIMVFDFQ